MQNLYAIPQELRDLPNWCLWKLTPIKGKKPTKVPHQINGNKASSTDPSTWTTFDEAFNVLQFGQFSGLGFMFGNTPYTGIDLDDCRYLSPNKDTGEILPNPHYETDYARQLKIFHEFNSYAERSPSGNGCHIIVKGKTPDGFNNRVASIELYPSGRFFTMTGDVVNNVPIAEKEELLNSLWNELGGKKTTANAIVDKPATNSDEEIIQLGLTHNSINFQQLLNGDLSGYPSQSEADLAFMNVIAYYSDNREQCARIYSNSKLASTDKKRRHKGYIERTVNKAFDLKFNVDFQGMDAIYDKIGSVAQRSEPAAHNGLVAGSSPATSTIYPPGLVGEIAQFIFDNAPKPIAEIALAGAIGMMAGICGRAYNISGTGLNQYVLLIAMTGAGKESAASGINKLMTAVKASVPAAGEFIGPSQISSGPALFKFLGNNSKSFVSMIGEFGLRLQQMSSNNASGSELSLRSLFLDLYNKSGASETLQQSIYSDKANNTSAIQSPSFSIFGESTAERFYGTLNEDMISEGLLPRFLVIEYIGNRVYTNEDRSNSNIPIFLGNKLVELCSHCLTINNSPVSNPIAVQMDDASKALLRKHDRDADDKINASDKDVIRQLWNRAHIKVLKLSALIAVGVNPYNPMITTEYVNWSIDLVSKDIKAITARFEAGEIGGNSFELKQIAEITKILRDYAMSDFAKMKSYKALEKLHKSKVVNYSYFSARLPQYAAFRNDRRGGLAAVKNAVQLMVDNGKLIELKGADLQKFETTARCFYIHPSILD